MSYQAATWAAKQRTGSPSAKSVLLALANYAGPMGDCYPSNTTIAEDTEQSRASVQRRMAELEAKGLIARFERFRKGGGQTTMEVVLLFSDKARAYASSRGWTPDIGVVASSKMLHADDDSDSGVADCDPVAVADCDAPGRTGATPGVSLVRPPIEPSSEKSGEPPPSPQGGSVVGGAALAIWERFEQAWGFEDPTDRREPARRAFDRLTISEAEAAIAAAGAYIAECKARQRKVCHAKTWLADRGWTGFTPKADAAAPDGFTRLPGGALIPANKFWVEAGSAHAAAWERYTRKTRGVGLFMSETIGPDGKRARGTWKETQWPPSTSQQEPPPPAPQAGMEARP